MSPTPNPNQEDEGTPFCWFIIFDLSGMGSPASSYDSASISHRVNAINRVSQSRRMELAEHDTRKKVMGMAHNYFERKSEGI